MKPECILCPIGRASPAGSCPFEERQLRPGAVLVRQGDTPVAVWYIKRGAVLNSSLSAAGEETYLALRRSGALIGTEGLVDRPSPCETWAMDNVVACRLPVAAFKEWIGDRTTPAAAVLDLLVEETRHLHDDRALAVGDATRRVSLYLLARARAATSQEDEPIAKSLLARVLGIRPETLSRAILRLRALGALTDDREIRVADATVLEQLAGEGDE